MTRARSHKKTLIAAAAFTLLAQAAMAQVVPPPVQIIIPQIVTGVTTTMPDGDGGTYTLYNNYLLEQNAINTILSEVRYDGAQASASLNLGVGNLGSTQFASNQFSTIGWGQTSGSLSTAINLFLTEQLVDTQVVRGAAVIDQRITREQLIPDWTYDAGSGQDVGLLGGSFANISQLISNTALLGVESGVSGAAGNVSIRGLSQIGSNAANAAAVNLSYGGTLNLTQRVDAFAQSANGQLVFKDHRDQTLWGSNIDGTAAGLGGLEQIVQNVMIANLGRGEGDAAGNGNAIIDGAYGENLALRSTQFGSNTVNSAVVGIAAGRQGTVNVDQAFGASTYWLGALITSDPTSNPGYSPATGFRYFVASDGSNEGSSTQGAALQGYRSSVTNVAIADAGNFYVPPAEQFSHDPAVLDPVVRNLDQIASFSGNAVTLVVPVAADPTQATATLQGAGQSFTSPRRLDLDSRLYDPTPEGPAGDSRWFLTSLGSDGYAQVPFQLSNLAVASNGNFGYDWRTDQTNDYYTPRAGRSIDTLDWTSFEGGRGDAIIEKLGQTTIASINSLNIVGPSSTTTGADGKTTTTVADAGLTRVNQFNQNVAGLRVQNMWTPTFEPQYAQQVMTGAVTLTDQGNDLGEDSSNTLFRAFFNPNLEYNGPYGYSEGNGAFPGYGGLWSNLAGGNFALAYTGDGVAAVRDINQLQSLSANTFSTTGSLQGVIDASYSVNAGGVPTGIPSMRQYADGVAVSQGNAAYALAENGTAMASGSQTLSFSLNNLTVGGTLSGNYEQIVLPAPLSVGMSDSPSVTQVNALVALTDSSSGVARIGDYAVNGTLTASPVQQTIVSSINTMTLANVANATITQQVGMTPYVGYSDAYSNPITQNSFNMVAALDESSRLMSATLSNINQAVLNKVNTISAYVPPKP